MNKTFFKAFALTSITVAERGIAALEIAYNRNDKFLREELDKVVAEELEKFNAAGNFDESEMKDFQFYINEYYGLSHLSNEILSQNLIVSAFGFYERQLKQILKLSGKFTEPEIRSMYRVAKIIELLNTKVAIVYSDLSDASKIEELRCLNNSIKHSAIVDSELVAANAKWIAGAPIENTYSDFVRLKDSVGVCLRDLVNKIETTL